MKDTARPKRRVLAMYIIEIIQQVKATKTCDWNSDIILTFTDFGTLLLLKKIKSFGSIFSFLFGKLIYRKKRVNFTPTEYTKIAVGTL